MIFSRLSVRFIGYRNVFRIKSFSTILSRTIENSGDGWREKTGQKWDGIPNETAVFLSRV